MSGPAERADLERRIAEHPWYHTLELAPGVLTPGWFDLRATIGGLPFPSDLTGMRCLDVGTFDGFWAFEMERRHAAEVVAIDILDPQQWDWPVGNEAEVVAAVAERKAGGAGFELAAEAIGSKVQRRARSVYDLDPDEDGQFDFIYVGSILLHLQNPVRALERVRSVSRGTVLFVDAIDLELSLLLPRKPVAHLDGRGRPWWWKPNTAGFQRMVEVGGFEVVEGPKRFFMTPGAGQDARRPPLRRLRRAEGREAAIMAWRGDPHASILGKPR
jgi:tRNA (mo5U34)-methyltransferase